MDGEGEEGSAAELQNIQQKELNFHPFFVFKDIFTWELFSCNIEKLKRLEYELLFCTFVRGTRI